MTKFPLFAVLAGFALCATAAAQDSSIPDATIRSYCEPAQVRIGEPFTLKVDIVHSERQRVLIDQPTAGTSDSSGIELEDRWILHEERRSVSLPIGDEPGMKLTQVRWGLFGLEPGEYDLTALGADCVASGAVQRLDPVPASIVVLPELVEGEDAARALLGFRDERPETSDPRGLLTVIVGGLIALVLVFLVVLIVRTRRPKSESMRGPTPLERLSQIDPADAEHAREAFYLLSSVVRETLDREAGSALDGLTDEEWIDRRSISDGIARDRLDRASQLLRSCETVKYGAESPTRWAVEEALTEARALCAGGGVEEGAA